MTAYVKDGTVEDFNSDLQEYERYGMWDYETQSTRPMKNHEEALAELVGATGPVFEVEIPLSAVHRSIVIGAKTEAEAILGATNWLENNRHYIDEINICCGQVEDLEIG